MAVTFLTPEQKSFYQENGYLIIPNIITDNQISLLKTQIAQILKNTPPEQIQSVFATGTDQKKINDKYFLSSADDIKVFMENQKFDLVSFLMKQNFKNEDNVTINLNLNVNKIGHALHKLDPVFSEFTHNNVFKQISHDIGVDDPVIPQSMYIFKSPGAGGIVEPHQDSTFLYTEPLSCHAFWIPLSDVNADNGCLWCIPGSHTNPLVYRFKLDLANKSTYFEPSINDDLTKDIWLEKDYVPIVASKGSLVLLHGSIVHKSGVNNSTIPRNVYTFHIVDANAKWDNHNWLQLQYFVKL